VTESSGLQLRIIHTHPCICTRVGGHRLLRHIAPMVCGALHCMSFCMKVCPNVVLTLLLPALLLLCFAGRLTDVPHAPPITAAVVSTEAASRVLLSAEDQETVMPAEGLGQHQGLSSLTKPQQPAPAATLVESAAMGAVVSQGTGPAAGCLQYSAPVGKNLGGKAADTAYAAADSTVAALLSTCSGSSAAVADARSTVSSGLLALNTAVDEGSVAQASTLQQLLAGLRSLAGAAAAGAATATANPAGAIPGMAAAAAAGSPPAAAAAYPVGLPSGMAAGSSVQ